MRPSRVVMLVLFASLLLAAPAHAIIRLPAVPAQVAHNPAERLLSPPIEDSVYDRGYWGAGMTQFEQYDPCYKHGKRRKRVDPIVGHINHLHIGLTKAAAARRTSFWSVAR